MNAEDKLKAELDFIMRGMDNAAIIAAMLNAGRKVSELRRDMRAAGRDIPEGVAAQYDAVGAFVEAMEKIVGELRTKYAPGPDGACQCANCRDSKAAESDLATAILKILTRSPIANDVPKAKA